METADGRRIVKADSLWTLLDLKKMFPAKVPEKIREAYPKEEKIEMEYLPRKITITGEEEKAEQVVVQKHHLDCNGHVNNGQYIKLASAYLPEGFEITRMRAEYKKQAYSGDVFYPYIYKSREAIIVCLNDEDKKPYVVVEFCK